MTTSSGAPHGEAGHVHDEACAAAHGELRLPPDPRRLVLVFASPVAEEMAALSRRLDWPVTVVDPDPARRDALASRPPAPGTVTSADVAGAGLDGGCDVVVCDHDRPELGDVLAAVLAAPTRWVGVMGSLRHTAPHVAALRERGVPEADIARVHRPIGLDIGSRTPAEIAVSTVAGLLADRNGRPGGPFAGRAGAVETPHVHGSTGEL
jgi:xanthine dehydrogenase accessory factor